MPDYSVNASPVGVFRLWPHSYKERGDLVRAYERGHFSGWRAHGCLNTLMSSWKERLAQAVYPLIEGLVITDQTGTPVDNETEYSGVIYVSTPGDEFSRSGPSNPFVVAWNIGPNDANGYWGSLITVDASGVMINRALAGFTKRAGDSVIIEFTGRIV